MVQYWILTTHTHTCARVRMRVRAHIRFESFSFQSILINEDFLYVTSIAVWAHLRALERYIDNTHDVKLQHLLSTLNVSYTYVHVQCISYGYDRSRLSACECICDHRRHFISSHIFVLDEVDELVIFCLLCVVTVLLPFLSFCLNILFLLFICCCCCCCFRHACVLSLHSSLHPFHVIWCARKFTTCEVHT